VVTNKEELTHERLAALSPSLIIFGRPRTRFSDVELDALNAFLQGGGSILVAAGENGDGDPDATTSSAAADLTATAGSAASGRTSKSESKFGGGGSNLNALLTPHGITVNTDAVVRSVYYKYLHPKEVHVGRGVVSAPFGQAVAKLHSRARGDVAAAAASASTASSAASGAGGVGADGAAARSVPPVALTGTLSDEFSAASLTAGTGPAGAASAVSASQQPEFTFVRGATLNVARPAVTLLSSGALAYPVRRPLAAVSETRSGRVGRVAVLGSAEMLADDWLMKECNCAVADALVRWLTAKERASVAGSRPGSSAVPGSRGGPGGMSAAAAAAGLGGRPGTTSSFGGSRPGSTAGGARSGSAGGPGGVGGGGAGSDASGAPSGPNAAMFAEVDRLLTGIATPAAAAAAELALRRSRERGVGGGGGRPGAGGAAGGADGGAAERDVADHVYVPDVASLAERLRPCLQESEPLPRDFTALFDHTLFALDMRRIPDVLKLYGDVGVKHEPLSLIPPQFETPLPPLQPAVFPPSMRELPPPALDLFDLDEQFASDKARLAQLANKCSGGGGGESGDDVEYFCKEAGLICGITPKLPEAARTAKHILEHLLRTIVQVRACLACIARYWVYYSCSSGSGWSSIKAGSAAVRGRLQCGVSVCLGSTAVRGRVRPMQQRRLAACCGC